MLYYTVVIGGAPWLGLAAHNFELARPSGYSTLWLRPAGAHRRLRNLAKNYTVVFKHWLSNQIEY